MAPIGTPSNPCPNRTRVVRVNTSHWPQWDAFLESHPSSTVCHTSAWCMAIEATFPHIKNHFIALEDTESHQIIAALPLYHLHSWLTGNRLVCVPFASWCDPLVQNAEDLQTLLNSVTEAHSPRQPKLEIRCRHSTHLAQQIPLHPASSCLHHTIPLNRSKDEIWQAISRTGIRRRIKQADLTGVLVQRSASPDDLSLFHQMLSSTRHRMGLPRIPLKLFTSLQKYLGPKRLTVFVAYSENQPVASVFTTWNQNTFNLDYLGEAAPDIPAGTSQLLYWKALELAIEQGCQEFSFGRTDPSQTGLAEYKLRWGATAETLTDLQSRPHPNPTSSPQGPGKNLVRAILRQLPAPLYNLAGNFFYRHR